MNGIGFVIIHINWHLLELRLSDSVNWMTFHLKKYRFVDFLDVIAGQLQSDLLVGKHN